MSVIRVHKTANFTVMSNHHFKEKKMSLKAKGLLSLMLSLPDDWDYSVAGLATLSKDGKDSVMSALGELEKFGYLTRTRLTNSKGQFAGIEYNIYEQPQEKPPAVKPISENENEEKPISEKPAQLNTYLNQELNNILLNELSTKGEELIELYQEYIKIREEMNAALTPPGLIKLIARAERLSNSNIAVEKILLENAIINNWRNVYPPRESELARLNQETQNMLRNMFGLD